MNKMQDVMDGKQDATNGKQAARRDGLLAGKTQDTTEGRANASWDKQGAARQTDNMADNNTRQRQAERQDGTSNRMEQMAERNRQQGRHTTWWTAAHVRRQAERLGQGVMDRQTT